jgi:hypothetical protein
LAQPAVIGLGYAPAARLGRMPALPRSSSSLLVRTDFTSHDAWRQVSDEAQRENEDGFRAYLEPVSDLAFDQARWPEVKAAVPAGDRKVMVLFVADSTALTAPDNPESAPATNPPACQRLPDSPTNLRGHPLRRPGMSARSSV